MSIHFEFSLQKNKSVEYFSAEVVKLVRNDMSKIKRKLMDKLVNYYPDSANIPAETLISDPFLLMITYSLPMAFMTLTGVYCI